MTPNQNALLAGSILLTADAISTFLAEHVTATCMVILIVFGIAVYRNHRRS